MFCVTEYLLKRSSRLTFARTAVCPLTAVSRSASPLPLRRWRCRAAALVCGQPQAGDVEVGQLHAQRVHHLGRLRLVEPRQHSAHLRAFSLAPVPLKGRPRPRVQRIDARRLRRTPRDVRVRAVRAVGAPTAVEQAPAAEAASAARAAKRGAPVELVVRLTAVIGRDRASRGEGIDALKASLSAVALLTAAVEHYQATLFELLSEVPGRSRHVDT